MRHEFISEQVEETDTLSQYRTRKLFSLEGEIRRRLTVIDSALNTVDNEDLAIASLLVSIESERLYIAAGFTTMTAYARDRWTALSKQRLSQILIFGRINAQIDQYNEEANSQPKTVLVDYLPKIKNERQARALKSVPKTERMSVMKEAVKASGGTTPTARVITETADRFKTLDTEKGPRQKRAKKVVAQAPKQRYGHGFRIWHFMYDLAQERLFAEVFKPGVPAKGWEPKNEKVSISLYDLEYEMAQAGFKIVPLNASVEAAGDTHSDDTDEDDDLPGPFTAGRDFSALGALTKPQPDMPLGIAEQAMSLLFDDEYPQ